MVGSTAPQVKGGTPVVEQVYLLDGTTVKRGADGSLPDAQFFCSLNKSPAEADFVIPELPPGATVCDGGCGQRAGPWRLSFLMRQEQGRWAMAGFYPEGADGGGS